MRRIVGFVLGMSLVAVAAPGSAQSTATTTQTGDNNRATITQEDTSELTVNQTGDRNQSTVSQTGSNVGTIDQISDADGSSGNVAFLTQANPEGMLGNVADIDQDARFPNSSIVVQLGSEGFARALQTGASAFRIISIRQLEDSIDNTAFALQTGAVFGLNAFAEINQSGGTTNFARTLQGNTTLADDPANAGITDSAFNPRARVNQTGSFLNSEIVQAGFNTEIFVNQVDAGSTSTVLQSLQGNASESIVDVFQGGSNTSFVIQSGDNNLVDVDQIDGMNNTSEVRQSLRNVGDSNEIYVTQRGGDDNSSIVRQNVDTIVVSMDNVATVLQDGSRNASTLDQDGSNNTASVSQFGDAASFLNQVGTNNSATVSQGTP